MMLCCSQGFAFQCLSGRLGLVTGEDLAQHCGKRWGVAGGLRSRGVVECLEMCDEEV